MADILSDEYSKNKKSMKNLDETFLRVLDKYEANLTNLDANIQVLMSKVQNQTKMNEETKSKVNEMQLKISNRIGEFNGSLWEMKNGQSDLNSVFQTKLDTHNLEILALYASINGSTGIAEARYDYKPRENSKFIKYYFTG